MGHFLRPPHVPNSTATALQQCCACSAASTAAAHHAKECGMQYCSSAAKMLRAAQHEWHMGQLQ